jgi:hypothetical protein
MSQSYPYAYATYFLAYPSITQATCDLHALAGLIAAQPVITHTLTNSVNTAVDVTFTFNGSLSDTETAALIAILNAYVYTQTYNFLFVDNFSSLVGTTIDPIALSQQIVAGVSSVQLQVLQYTYDVNSVANGVYLMFVGMLAPQDTTALTAVLNAYIYVVLVDTNTVTYSESHVRGTNGGSFVANIWTPRILNTADVAGVIQWSSLDPTTGQITLRPITGQSNSQFRIYVSAPASGVRQNQCRLWNVTTDTLAGSGSSMDSQGASTMSTLMTSVTVSGPTIFRVDHICTQTVQNTGFGVATAFNPTETYTQVTITK